MTPIGLDDMKAVRMMNRMDQKYMARADQLEELLARIAEGNGQCHPCLLLIEQSGGIEPARIDNEGVPGLWYR